MSEIIQAQFQALGHHLFKQLKPSESLVLQLDGEQSEFLRLTQARVRQATAVTQWDLTLHYRSQGKANRYLLQLGEDFAQQIPVVSQALESLRSEAKCLPDDPFSTPIVDQGSLDEQVSGALPEVHQWLADLAPALQGADFAGFYAGGRMCRGLLSNAGTCHWYQTDCFSLDYSLYFGDRAVKGCYAGRHWQATDAAAQIESSKRSLELLKSPRIKVAPGTYRCYFAPAAVADLLSLMAWSGFSYGAFKRGGSPLVDLYEGRNRLHSAFSLAQDFSLGFAPRFNQDGEIAPEKLPLIVEGEAGDLLIAAATAKEYGVISNGANMEEQPISLSLSPGGLPAADVLARLGTGLYIANVHYLNWSDRLRARFTGMTRFACFWVEQGRIVGPIEDMRFDETLYRCFGSELEELTVDTELAPNLSTYGRRQFGATRAPGALVRCFTLTL